MIAYLLDMEAIVFRETVITVLCLLLIFGFLGWMTWVLHSGDESR